MEVAPIRREPGDAAEQVTQALRGEPLAVEEERGQWALVRTAYDYPGWIRAEHLAPGPAPREWPAQAGDDPVDEARTYLGAPYLWGGMSERGIDCSGLVHMAYRRCGRLVPRDAYQQEDAGREVAEPDARRGDLVTYGDRTGLADHVAFWLGDGRILHATARAGLGCVEEAEPPELRVRRRRFVRLKRAPQAVP